MRIITILHRGKSKHRKDRATIRLLFTLVGLLLITCKNEVKKENKKELFNAQVITQDTLKIMSTKKEAKDSIPFKGLGSSKLIKTDFPKTWNVEKEKSVQTRMVNNTNIQVPNLNAVYQNIDTSFQRIPAKYLLKGKKSTITFPRAVYKKREGFMAYSDNCGKELLKQDSFYYKDYVALAKIPRNERINIILFKKNATTASAGLYYSKIDLLTMDMNEKIVDGINIQYDFIQNHINVQKKYFIDKDFIIHLKQFASEDVEYNFHTYEKWKIMEDGKVLRFYEQNGMFNNEEERGMVVNNVRDGEWVECKYNSHVQMPTYLEAKFSLGIPTGTWRYYAFSFALDDDGNYRKDQPIKNQLLYTEIYRKGKLSSRTFNDTSKTK